MCRETKKNNIAIIVRAAVAAHYQLCSRPKWRSNECMCVCERCDKQALIARYAGARANFDATHMCECVRARMMNMRVCHWAVAHCLCPAITLAIICSSHGDWCDRNDLLHANHGLMIACAGVTLTYATIYRAPVKSA